MRKIIILISLLFYSVCTLCQTKFINNEEFIIKEGNWYIKDSVGGEFLVDPDVITLKFKSGLNNISANVDLLMDTYEGIKVLRISKRGFVYIKVPSNMHSLDLVEILVNDPLINLVYPNTYGRYCAVPNDQRYYLQWHLQKIKMNNVWSYYPSGQGIIVGILDTGVDWLHQDIGLGTDSYQNVWLNSLENDWTDLNNPASGNANDDDGNNYEDDWKGYDFEDDDNNALDYNGHGTRVAGIVSAKGNNSIGVAGVAGGMGENGVSLMPIGIGVYYPQSSIIEDAIDYAVDNGARVINMSFVLSTSQYDNAIKAALEDAYEAGVVLVAAAGNSSSSVEFPANDPHVIAVGGTTSNDTKASFACYGENLTISAPAEGIYTTTRNNGYGAGDGTSFSAPQVAAAAALLLIINPYLFPNQIRQILTTTADKVGGYNYNWNLYKPGHSKELGYGRLDVEEAIGLVLPVISGPNIVCTSNSTFTLTDFQIPASVSWNLNPGYLVTPYSGIGSTAIFHSTCSSIGNCNLYFTVSSSLPYIRSFKVLRTIISGGPDPYDVELDVLYSSGQQAPNMSGTWLLCPNTSYHIYLMNRSSCSTSNYIWTIPPTWTKFYQYNNMISINTNSQPGGQIMVDATTCCTGCGSVRILIDYVGQYGDCGSRYYMAFPNPADDYLDIDINEEKMTADGISIGNEYAVTIVDKMGVMKYTDEFKEFPYRINTRNLPEGLYIINLLYEGKISSIKVVVEH